MAVNKSVIKVLRKERSHKLKLSSEMTFLYTNPPQQGDMNKVAYLSHVYFVTYT